MAAKRAWDAAAKDVWVLDGAWGTELVKLGLPAGVAPELWNADRPEAVEQVARGYVEAGADILLTNTLGGTRVALARHGLADRTEELNRLGAEISCRAAACRAFVFASVGPTGEMLEPLGAATEAGLADAFAEQMAALSAGGADGFCIESMSDLGEALAALRAARRVGGDRPAVVSMTFTRGARGYATMMGVRPEQAARALSEAGADVIGSNCGNGIAGMVEVARLMRSATDRPLWMKANAGVPELVGGRTVFRETPEAMAAHVPALIQAGAAFIGGCCGTTPDHIRRIAEAVRQARGRSPRRQG